MGDLKIAMRPKDSENELRKFCADVRKIIGNTPVIVELGSYMGESSLIFAEEFPESKIYCIDSWEGGFDDDDGASHSDYLDVEHQFDLRIAKVPNITKIKGYTTDNSIECDMVYIDACHKYECVLNDIKHWTPFVRKVISGHDYFPKEVLTSQPHIIGVKVAVDELLGSPDKVFGDGSWYKKLIN